MSGGFADLGLLPELLQAIDDQGWTLPTDIQDEAIPLILGGGDVMGAAETGSGKTAAFALPILQSVYERLKSLEDTAKKPDSGPVTVHLNDLDRDSDIVLENPYSCSYLSTEKWQGIRGNFGVKYGKVYYECQMKGTGNCRVGFSMRLANLDLGKDKMGYGYGAKGFKSTEGAFDKYGELYSDGDIIGCMLDLVSKTVQFSKNGKVFDVAYPLHPDVVGAVFFPAITLSGSSAELNFGQSPMRFLPPGFTPLDKVGAGNLFHAESVDAYTIQGKRKPLAITILPTRDLAEQVYQSFVDLSKYIDAPKLKISLLIGDDNKNVKRELAEGVDIVIGTIGKLTSLLQNRQLDLSHIRFFVLDEADRLTTSDNLSTVKQIFSHCPQGGTGVHRLQVCFFSATLHDPAIKELSETICFNPIWIDLKGAETVMPDTLHHVLCPLSTSPLLYEKYVQKTKPVTDNVHIDGDFDQQCVECTMNQMSQRVKDMKPFIVQSLIDKYKMNQVMVFCRTNLDCSNLERFFQSQSKDKLLVDKYTCAVLGGMMSMEDRRRNLQRFKDGEMRILICTDVAARGIDIDSLPYVINVTLPDQPDDYVHRVGRAGRADRMGLAISIVAMECKEKVWFHTCGRKDRGLGCTNRKLVETGGCTVWYDESQLVARVEKKINNRIAIMDVESLDLPAAIQALNVRYGESAAESVLLGDSKVYMTETMIGKVRTLAELETQAQNIFLHMCVPMSK